jgi:RNA polymerase sigma-70 factor (ECF subfamily)
VKSHLPLDQSSEVRFRAVFAHLGSVVAFARRRGSQDPEGIAAEAMTIAWRRLADVPQDDPRPWLYATARNLMHAERRAAARPANAGRDQIDDPGSQPEVAPEAGDLDPSVAAALAALSPIDREALLLVAWEDLTPKLAAATLGINAGAFRVRFHRARRRFRRLIEESNPAADIGEPRMERA